jgi:hypothetical protein
MLKPAIASGLCMTSYSRNAVVHQERLDPGVSLLQKPITQVALAHRIREVHDKRPDHRR